MILASEDEIHDEIFEALHRIKKESNLSSKFNSSHIRPVSVPLQSNGELLRISCNNVDKFYTGESNIIFEYIIPRKLINMTDEHTNSYAKEVYESESLSIVQSLIKEIFNVQSVNFMYSDTTNTMHVFRNIVSLSNPTIAPTKEDYEIQEVLTVNVEKKYVYKKKNQNMVHKLNKDDTDMIIYPNSEKHKVEFDNSVNLFGTELNVRLEEGDGLSSRIALEKNGKVYGYVHELNGNWTHLINAQGQYNGDSMF